jgi:hypothetical protein
VIDAAPEVILQTRMGRRPRRRQAQKEFGAVARRAVRSGRVFLLSNPIARSIRIADAAE